MSQMVKITSKAGNVLNLAEPLLYTYSNSPTAIPMWPDEGFGLEDLSIVCGNPTNGGNNILVDQVANSWIKNVTSLGSGAAHIRLILSAHVTIEHCYLDSRSSAYQHDSDRAYGILCIDWNSGHLIQNNIAEGMRHSWVMEAGGSGIVWAYNYSLNVFTDNPGYLTQDFDTHGGAPMFNLAEGNVFCDVKLDNQWGSAAFITIFRTWSVNDSDVQPVSDGQDAIDIQAQTWYSNIVGCVVSSPSITGGSKFGTSSTSKSAYRLGAWAYAWDPHDSGVATTTYIHGSYDHFSDSLTWDAGNADHTLPNSLYLSAEPSWFGDRTWPPIDPVTGPSAVSVDDIPAGYRYLNGVDPPSDTAPSTVSATVSSSGTSVAIVFSEAVQFGAGGSGGFVLNIGGGGTVTLSSPSIIGSTVTYSTLSRVISSLETATLAYVQPGNGAEASDDNVDVSSFSGLSVTNNSTVSQVVAPIFTPAGGIYFGTQGVVITSSTPGTTRRYTTDGTDPTSSSTLYVSPVPVSTPTTLKARAFAGGFIDSDVTTATYEVGTWVSVLNEWKTFTIPQQTGVFPWTFRATPSALASNTVIGLGPVAVDEFIDMAVLVRFGTDNTINVRNGGVYEGTMPYTAGTSYDFVCSVNLTNQTYSVNVTPVGGSTTTLATNVAFRSEHVSTTELDNFGLITQGAGTLSITNMDVGSDSTAPTPNPMTFSSVPTALDPFSVTMTASLATDDLNNPVEYYFEETTGHVGATDSGWQESRTYVDSGLSPNTQYIYYVWARDQMLNQGSPSGSFEVTTPTTPGGGGIDCTNLNATTITVGP